MFKKCWSGWIGFMLLMGVQAAHAEKDVFVTPKVGISAMTGVFGVEVQYKHWAFDIGYPLAGGIRYYVKPPGHSWFGGLYGLGFGYDHDETKDGITYTHHSIRHAGLAAGYRWLWRSRWSLELGMAVGMGSERWSNDFAEKRKDGAFVSPVAAVGIAF